jgi:putative peptidoglycan lipid II flippase
LVFFALIAYGVIFYVTLIHITGTQRLGLRMRRMRRRG